MRYTALLLLAATLVLAKGDKPTKIKATGRPGKAALFIDGAYIGPVERFTVTEKYTVTPGEHTVSIRDPRYEDYSAKVTCAAGKTTKVKFRLKMLEPAKPPFGRLRLGGGEAESFFSVSAGDTGAVYINGKYYGYVDELNNPGGGLLLNPGTYEVHVVSPLFGDFKETVTIEANKVSIVPLPKKKG